MAKLSAHGTEIGRIHRLGHTYAYMSDGTKLVNYGSGWKIKGKLKAGLTPELAFANAKAKIEAESLARPAFAEYRKELHAIAGIGKSARLHMTISMMPEDCDGVWSECCDGYGDNVHADLDEIAELCRLFRVAVAEKSILLTNEGK